MLRFLILVVPAILLAGCFNAPKNPGPKVTFTPKMGLIDMQKAIQSHPRYKDFQEMQKQYNTLVLKLKTAQGQARAANGGPAPQALSSQQAAGLDETLSAEFKSKMTAQQNTLQAQLNEKLTQVRSDLNKQMDEYKAEVDKTYQPQIFNLQLKLKTLRLSKEEMTSLQQQLEQLQNERDAKLAAKQKELQAKMNEAMAPESKAMQTELDQYAKQLRAELDQEGAAKRAQMLAAAPLIPPVAPAAGANDELVGQLNSLKEQMQTLQEQIVQDIRDKTAKVAAEKGLDTVLTNVTVNASGVDVTDAVIAEFKK
ncbi:OmpH family outer membrane protein [Lucifera butyrica]|nr:OmpH family outer membrane protein [Lucifera butyrica]